ncbi:IS30 family transposase [Candidatus Saccharibacteria bacterium QS_5_54_17]|nr:MAG: IS30 family transposase [Candidatus Saccharibacteria bacterium QS_5_54_17]
MKQHHTKLTPVERDKLALWHAQGLSNREIGRRLGRSHTTIAAEIRQGGPVGGEYVAIRAQHLSEQRRARSYQRHPLKNPWLYAYVHARLGDGWSPEQISGRLKRDYPREKTRHINHETIYRFIYAEENKGKRLWEYLPRKQKKRRKQGGRKTCRSRIPNRVSIHQRPVTVEERAEFGHFEGDSIEGRRVHKDGIHTEVERKSRKTFARKVDRIASAETLSAQLAIFATLPPGSRLSTTLDNGKEHSRHEQLTNGLGTNVYFADPYSSWQRGTNEYHKTGPENAWTTPRPTRYSRKS